MRDRHSRSMSLARYLKQFRSVLAVGRAGSAAHAAQLLPLSSSAIARAIRELEGQLGVALFERAARGMLMTAEGKLLARRAERALAQLALAETEASSLADPGARAAWQMAGRFSGSCAYRHLATYVAFCETGGELAAAARLRVSQPAVNQTLRQLEHMLGSVLFYRSVRGVRLTESGEAVLRRTKLALAEFRHAEEDLMALHGKMSGRIVIGSLPLSAGVLVPRAVDRVLALHKDLNVTIVDGTYGALMHQLRHADVDVVVGALRGELTAADVVQEPLFEDTLSVVVRQGHPLVGKSLAGLRDLVGESWIAPLTGTPARAAFERAFAADGVAPPHASLEVNSAVVLQALLMDSNRLALLSRRQIIRGVSAGLLQVLPVEVRETGRYIGLTMRADSDLGASMRSFVAELRALCQETD
ncbi:MAG: LysR family transcriptional regulator [Burkholderiaceae bacterium]|nr:MAG: LysR family transcriptional regulator [Burkholderiaceae bacterium]TAM09104.1 MAG: LysR family transcriptional regulator [Pusillimonas sp.]